MSFTDQQQRIATAEDCKLPWSGSQKRFRCGLCGHKFVIGDKWRFVFTNSKDIDCPGGNPLVCGQCDSDGTNEAIYAKWKAMHEEWKIIKQRFWKFLDNFSAEVEQEYENNRSRR